MGKYCIKVQTTTFISSLPTHKIIKTKNDPEMSLLMLYHTSLSSAGQIGLIDSIHRCTVIVSSQWVQKTFYVMQVIFLLNQNTMLSFSLKEKYASLMVQYILQSKE